MNLALFSAWRNSTKCWRSGATTPLAAFPMTPPKPLAERKEANTLVRQARATIAKLAE